VAKQLLFATKQDKFFRETHYVISISAGAQENQQFAKLLAICMPKKRAHKN